MRLVEWAGHVVYPLTKLVRRIRRMFNKQLYFVLMALGFGYIFPIGQKLILGIPLSNSERLGGIIIVLGFVLIWLALRDVEKKEKEERSKELKEALVQALSQAGLTKSGLKSAFRDAMVEANAVWACQYSTAPKLGDILGKEGLANDYF